MRQELKLPFYLRAPALGAAPRFIDALADLAERALHAPGKLQSETGGRICPAQFGLCAHGSGTLMEHMIGYDLARGLHIIAVIAWIAGLLMLPRFYAYITASPARRRTRSGDAEGGAQPARSSSSRPRSCWPGRSGFSCSRPTWSATGAGRCPRCSPASRTGSGLKLMLVLGLSGYQGFLSAEGRKLAAGERRHSEKFWRLMSEIPFLVAIAAVLLATLEP